MVSSEWTKRTPIAMNHAGGRWERTAGCTQAEIREIVAKATVTSEYHIPPGIEPDSEHTRPHAVRELPEAVRQAYGRHRLDSTFRTFSICTPGLHRLPLQAGHRSVRSGHFRRGHISMYSAATKRSGRGRTQSGLASAWKCEGREVGNGLFTACSVLPPGNGDL